MKVIKKNGSSENFDQNKIRKSVLVAFDTAGGVVPSVVPLVDRVCSKLRGKEVLSSVIGALVEEDLMVSGFTHAAKAYILYRSDTSIKCDNSIYSEYIHASKYARPLEGGGRESMEQTIDRCMNMHIQRFGMEKEITEAFEYVRKGMVSPSMRSLQFGGPKILRDNVCMFNCSYTLCDRARVFQEIMYILLCGCGVGYSVQWEHVNKLPAIIGPSEKVYHFTVADDIKGWANAVGALINSYMVEGSEEVCFNYSLIRPEGAVLKTAGGHAPGHKGLARTLEAVRKVLENAKGRKLRPLEVHDIVCHIAEAVVSGGVRRSSLISLFSPTDTEMLFCKSRGAFEPLGLNNQRQMANNSAVFVEGEDREWFDRVQEISRQNYGDPGFVIVKDRSHGTNPCGEIGLNPVFEGETGFAFCNLTEVALPNCESAEVFWQACKAASFIGTLQATYSDMPYLGEVTRAIHERDRLLGVSVTGLMNASVSWGWLSGGVQAIREENNRVAKILGIATAARLTCVKPSGKSSAWLSSGGEFVESGIHAAWSERYVRGVTESRSNPVAQEFRRINPGCVQEKPNGDLFLRFPIQSSGGLTVEEVSVDDQVKNYMYILEHWVKAGTNRGDLCHNVSCTITGDMSVSNLWELSPKALSFAPLLVDMIFPFAPMSKSTDWGRLVEQIKAVNYSHVKGTDVDFGSACEGPACEVTYA